MKDFDSDTRVTTQMDPASVTVRWVRDLKEQWTESRDVRNGSALHSVFNCGEIYTPFTILTILK